MNLQTIRLQQRIIKLGGTVPKPWPWAIISGPRKTRAGEMVTVDSAIYNLQLLELVEELEKK